MKPYSINNHEGMKAAVEWTTGMISHITDGGVWVVPRTMSIYKVHHSRKTLTRVVGCDTSVERVFK